MPIPDARTLLAGIGGVARPAGSGAEATARRLCAGWLRESGFRVEERPFTYSAFPGMWGTPIAGLALLVIAVAAAIRIVRTGNVDASIEGAVAGLVIVALLGWWVGRYGTRRLPFMRRPAVNLEARRGVTGETPTVWLIAHLDSKSQPVSLLTRAAAIVVLCLCWAAVLIVWIVFRQLPAAAHLPAGVLLAFLACAALAAVPLLISLVGVRSDGALDNASGVASILSAVRDLGLASPVGIVVTSAEEYGLAGARAWVETASRGIAINCDGVDDQGILTITADTFGRAMLRSVGAANLLGPDVRIRRSLPGILLDSVAFSDAGWAACTVSRGTVGSLARVHTGRDTLEEISGSGIDSAANLIASLAGAIIADGSSSEYQKGGSGTTWNNND